LTDETDYDPVRSIEVDALFLANGAETREGLLYVLGGAWSRCWPPDGKKYPYERALHIVAVFRIPWADTNVRHVFKIEVLDDDRYDAAPPITGEFTVGRPSDLTNGASQVIALSAAPPVKLKRPGMYHIAVSANEVLLKSIEFEALKAAPKQTGR
jgi:hypothetical protein